MGPIKRCGLLSVLLALVGCGNNIPTPPVAQWTCFKCSGMNLNSDGSFNFPSSSGAVGYIYQGVSGDPIGKTITMQYTVSGSGTVLPSAASGSGSAQVRLFLWRKGDDLACSSTTEWYRWWSIHGAGPLTNGQFKISAPVTFAEWTDCFARQDASQFTGTTSNLLGAGYTFGSEFFGHGVYSTGSNKFQLNSFVVQ